MIRVMTIAEENGATVLLFKLTSPHPKRKEILFPDVKKLGLTVNVWKALGYTPTLQNSTLDRYKDGPLYMQITVQKTKPDHWTVIKVQQFRPRSDGMIEVLPMPELAEV